MANPTWVTEDIEVDGRPQNVVVLRETEDEQTVIVWDNLREYDQNVIAEFVEQYGGEAPLTAPVKAYQTVEFVAGTVGATTLGLDTTVAAAGTAKIVLTPTTIGATPLNLVQENPILEPTPAIATVTVTGATASTTVLTLTDDEPPLQYTLGIEVDGVVTLAEIPSDTTYTLTQLASALDAQYDDITVTVSGSNLVFTTAQTGADIAIVFDNDSLFTELTTQGHSTTVSSNVPGQDADPFARPTYLTTTIEIQNGNVNSVPVKLFDVKLEVTSTTTVANYVSALNSAIATYGTATLAGGVITITPTQVSGYAKVFNITPTLPGYQRIEITPPAKARSYSFDVNVDGTVQKVTVLGSAVNTVSQLVTAINTQLTGVSTTIIPDRIRLASTADDALETYIEIQNDQLFKYTTGFRYFNEPAEGANDLFDVLSNNYAPNGTKVITQYRVVKVPVSDD